MAQDNTHYDAVIMDLEAKRDQLNAMIDSLKQMKAVGLSVALGSPSLSARPITEGEIPHDAFFNMTIQDAAKKYLSIVKHTRPNPELCDALLNGGFKTNAANFRETVRATLSRQPEFVKIGGQWGLKEWYGNRGKRKPRRFAGADQNGQQSANKQEEQEDEYSDVDEIDKTEEKTEA
jgi:hypothetical protein